MKGPPRVFSAGLAVVSAATAVYAATNEDWGWAAWLVFIALWNGFCAKMKRGTDG